MEYSNTYAEINLDAILKNYAAIQNKAGAPVMAVVKADAYGHGAVAVARCLQDRCDFFGVSSAAEALELRRAGIKNSILILGHTPPQCFGALVEQDIRVSIFLWEDALALSQEAVRQKKTAAVHLVVDTGMSRIGFPVTREAADTCAKIAALPNIKAEGLFSHFATADTEDLTRTKKQAALFDTFCQMLDDRNVEIPIKHMDNSAAMMHFGCQYQMVRAGIVLYGLYPSDAVDQSALPITPAMRWCARLSQVKALPAGCQISYGGTFETTRPTIVGTVSAGYADGYRRSLSGRFYVLINGKRAPILGRVCMDQFMVDLTDIPEAKTGDRVVLMGQSGSQEISAEALAEASGSFNYEQICDLSRRVARVYFRNGEAVGHTDYLLD